MPHCETSVRKTETSKELWPPKVSVISGEKHKNRYVAKYRISFGFGSESTCALVSVLLHKG